MIAVMLILVPVVIQANAGYLALNHALAEIEKTTVYAPPPSARRLGRFADRAFATMPASMNRRVRSLALIAQADESGAVALWMAADTEQTDEWIVDLLMRADRAATNGRFKEAHFWLKNAMLIQPNLGDIYLQQGHVYMLQGDENAAMDVFESALEPEIVFRDNVRGDVLCAIGWLHHWLMQPREPQLALDYYNRALRGEHATSDPDCIYKRAELQFWAFKEPNAALQDYKLVVVAQPDNLMAHVQLVTAQYRLDGDLQSAEKSLRALWENFPDQALHLERLGDLYRDSGQPAVALDVYRQAAQIEPDSATLTQKIEAVSADMNQ
jgi:tetratricopeptide (TPR) repeat protein